METFNQLLDKLCGKDKWIAYCINLDRASKRKTNFLNFCEKVGLNVNIWSATDKLTLTPDDYKKADVYINYTSKSPGATACRLSHHSLITHLLTNHSDKEYYFILEDDAGFKTENTGLEDLNDYINDIIKNNINFDHIWFGYIPNVMIHSQIITPITCQLIRTHLTHSMLFKKQQLEYHLLLLTDDKYKQLAVDWTADLLRELNLGITLGPVKNIITQTDDFSFIGE